MTPLPLYPHLPPGLASLSAELQRTIGHQVADYAKRLQRSTNVPRSSKIINDPVWRTTRLEPWEVVVVDSPLLQRLRRIHQLGLAGYVFPGANYTRFEHSVGVLHQVKRVIESIRRNARSLAARKNLPQPDPISASEEELLRLTALTHDVGHGFLSHVSERAVSHLSTTDGASVRQLQEEAKSFFHVPEFSAAPAIGEILSALSVLLPEWSEVLSLARIHTWSDTQTLSFRSAQLMCGGRDPKRPFLSEIISGPLDVDKLDYIPRDCYMAGVPMPVDVDRLLEKIQVVTVPASQISHQEYIEEFSIDPDSTVQVLAVQTSGSQAFEELVLSRFLLYEKLYYHQKIRAMEGAVVNALEILQTEGETFKRISTYLQLSDDEFLLAHWPSDGMPSPRVEVAKNLISQVVARNTLARCFAFGPGLVKDLEPDSEQFRTGWKALESRVTAKRGKAYLDFRKRVTERAKSFLRLAGQSPLADALVEDQIVIDLPPVQGIAEKTKFFIGDEQFGVDVFFNRFRVERWAEAYEMQHTIGYVYAPIDFAVAVFLAVRDLVWVECRLSFDDASWTRTKLRSAELREFSGRIAALDSTHYIFSEPDFILQRRSFSERSDNKLLVIKKFEDVLSDLVERSQTFESHDGVRISLEGTQNWLLQFPVEEIPLAVRVLGAVKFWGRSAISDALAFSVSDRFPVGFQALALGGPTASATHLSYLWDDVRPKINQSLNVVSTPAELNADLPLVIYDDNVGSGGQAGTVFSQWFGSPSLEADLSEQHVAALSEPDRDKLRNIPLLLVFATGFRSGLKKILTRLQDLTGNSDVQGLIIDPADLGCFRPAARVFAHPDEARRAEESFKNAGRLALGDKVMRSQWAPEKTDDRLLGYGNAGGLTVFHYNVPTTTLTALWSTSLSGQSKWTALFPRRPRIV